MRQKVLIGLSGGVDSSVSAYLLKKRGYEVIGFTFIQNEEEHEDVKYAEKVAKFLDIKLIKRNIFKLFEEKVIKYYIENLKIGYTPSPCIICDDEVKFELLFKVANELNIEYVATGHYAKVEYFKKYDKYMLKVNHNIIKDQCYMLYRLSEKRLKKLIFPLENIEKKDTREIARNNNLLIYDKKDSQGLCFAKEGYKKFLESYFENNLKEGNFIDKYGNILGKHKGYIFYTVGQRRGLGINFSKPMFITRINAQTNEITLGEYRDLLKKKVEIINYKFNADLEMLINKKFLARPRFSSKGFFGTLIKKESKLFFEYEEENTHNTNGQHIVLFDNNYVIGGGEIKIIEDEND